MKPLDIAFRKKIIIEDYEKGNEINVVGIVENKKLKILYFSKDIPITNLVLELLLNMYIHRHYKKKN